MSGNKITFTPEQTEAHENRQEVLNDPAATLDDIAKANEAFDEAHKDFGKTPS